METDGARLTTGGADGAGTDGGAEWLLYLSCAAAASALVGVLAAAVARCTGHKRHKVGAMGQRLSAEMCDASTQRHAYYGPC
jgi:hypothetical protein